MSATKKSWNAVVAAAIDDENPEEFKRDTEVQVKLVAKPSREYIYELLTKARFPLFKIEAIIERRSNTVDFTCKDRDSAEHLQRLLEKHPNVREARLFESEFIDVKLIGVPHRLPDGKIIAFLSRRNGEVLKTKRLKDRRGYYDGRRIYTMRTDDLKERPIPQLLRICECSIKAEYYGQPIRCYLCKKYGHMRTECPDAIKTPPIVFTEVETAYQMQISEQQDAAVPGNNTSTPVQRQMKLPQASPKRNLQEDDTAPAKPTTENEQLQKEAEAAPDKDPLDASDSEFSSTISEPNDTPDEPVFITDDEDPTPRTKRLHSPDEVKENIKKMNVAGETFDCACGNIITMPHMAGLSTLCTCGRCYAKCACENVVSTVGDMPANCDKCRRPVARRHLDVTM